MPLKSVKGIFNTAWHSRLEYEMQRVMSKIYYIQANSGFHIIVHRIQGRAIDFYFILDFEKNKSKIVNN